MPVCLVFCIFHATFFLFCLFFRRQTLIWSSDCKKKNNFFFPPPHSCVAVRAAGLVNTSHYSAACVYSLVALICLTVVQIFLQLENIFTPAQKISVCSGKLFFEHKLVQFPRNQICPQNYFCSRNDVDVSTGLKKDLLYLQFRVVASVICFEK